jgi:hypothetical protein
MKRTILLIAIASILITLAGCANIQIGSNNYGACPLEAKASKWAVHDPNRPHPKVITPGMANQPPSDAIVLFDGTDLSEWTSAKTEGKPAI